MYLGLHPLTPCLAGRKRQALESLKDTQLVRANPGYHVIPIPLTSDQSVLTMEAPHIITGLPIFRERKEYPHVSGLCVSSTAEAGLFRSRVQDPSWHLSDEVCGSETPGRILHSA